ncbi:MAG: acylphosphatase [Burkholderiales bacterium]|nr:acylphosphatase [Burkholderiales bacterium]
MSGTVKTTKHLSIRGKVQGVGFRESMRAEADRLGVTGWVRNRFDGSVEAVVQGSPEQVDAIVAWCHKGPPAAQVLRVEMKDEGGEYRTFQRHSTA